MTTVEKNKMLMNRFVEFINTASEELSVELISPDAVFYAPTQTEPFIGPTGYMQVLGMMRGGFPDVQWTLMEMIGEDNTIAARFLMRGTHQNTFFGIPATGKKIEVQAMNFYRFSDGKIIGEHGQPDLLNLLKQLGALPM